MSGDFFDSNVFLYLLDEVDGRKRGIAERLIVRGLEERNARISFQDVQEVLNTITRKVEVVATAQQARDFLAGVLMPLWHVMPSVAVYESALNLQERYGYAFYDSLIMLQPSIRAVTASSARTCNTAKPSSV